MNATATRPFTTTDPFRCEAKGVEKTTLRSVSSRGIEVLVETEASGFFFDPRDGRELTGREGTPWARTTKKSSGIRLVSWKDAGSLPREIQESAKKMADAGPVEVRVVQCQTNVGHRVQVVTVDGRADEGGDHHGGGQGNDGYTFALSEARDIAKRLGSRATVIE